MTTALDLCSLAWGDTTGYVFLSVRNPDTQRWRNLDFRWPEDKGIIQGVLDKAEGSKNDVYFAPAVFKSPKRQRSAAKASNVLWADLDTVDPDTIPDKLKPTALWETSPNHYQALWLVPRSLKPDEHDDLNQRLTYALGADKGGWGLSKVLRIPGTRNHKYKELPEVKLLSMNGHMVEPLDVAKLDSPGLLTTPDDTTEDLPRSDDVYRATKSKLPIKAKEMLKANNAIPRTRSQQLWFLECLLAEAGLEPAQIVSLVKGTVWNKFKGRRDELSRLFLEARKAIDHTASEPVPKEPQQVSGSLTTYESPDDDEAPDYHAPLKWNEFDHDRRAVSWLVADVWGEGEVGFISGLPKSYKSWIAYDLAVSVATGTKFLGTFQCKKRNVLLVQEEDPKPVTQDRLSKIAAEKGLIYAKELGKGRLELLYDLPDNLFISLSQGLNVTSEDNIEMLEGWVKELDIGLIIFDPLMMMAEGVDEFKAFDFMTKALKPLKVLRSHTNSAISVVHHHVKTEKPGQPGQAMYGSVALWAWEEAAIHLKTSGMGRVRAERFSKHSLLTPINIDMGDTDKGWHPAVSTGVAEGEVLDYLSSQHRGVTIDDVMSMSGSSRDAAIRQMNRLVAAGQVEKGKGDSVGPGRKKITYRLAGATEEAQAQAAALMGDE